MIAGGISDTADYGKELKELAADDNRIVFTGFVQGRILNELYSNAYIYCLPSDLEGMPLSLLEAMSYGLACVSFDCVSGPSEIIQDGINGFLVETGNELALVEKLNLLIENEVLRNKISQEAIYVRKKYNIETIGKKYINILSKF